MKSVEEEKKNVIEWLKHPHELGKDPHAVEYVKTVTDEEGSECMIFKYKKDRLGHWLLAISSESGIFSHMEKYDPATDEKDAIELLGALKQFWKNKAAEIKDREERAKKAGAFLAFVLLKEAKWEPEKFEKDFEADWGTRLTAPESKDGDDRPTRVYTPEGTDDGAFFAVSLIDRCVPNEEAEYHARFNYMWRDAVAVTKTHQAHMIVTVMGHADPRASGTLFAKALATLCKWDNTIGVYYNDVVAEPRFMVAVSDLIRQDQFPLLSLVWFGLGRSEKGIDAYTCGLRKFGKDELEILNSDKDPGEIRGFLMNIAAYVIGEDVILHDGETIGVSNEQRVKIVRSEGVNVSGDSLKILY